jgi:Flp pilus assembly protein TadG
MHMPKASKVRGCAATDRGHEGAVSKPGRRGPGTRRRRSRGQSLAEFALIFPLFILLLAAMVDFGIGLYSYMSLVNATREGARLAATNCSVLTCTDAVKARVTAASLGLNPSTDVACAKAAGGIIACTKNTAIPPVAQNGVKNGDSITVTSHYTYHMIWPLTFGTQIQMTSTVTFMAE